MFGPEHLVSDSLQEYFYRVLTAQERNEINSVNFDHPGLFIASLISRLTCDDRNFRRGSHCLDGDVSQAHAACHTAPVRLRHAGKVRPLGGGSMLPRLFLEQKKLMMI